MKPLDVLIVSWDGGGNVPPALALATRLHARGHRVRVATSPALRAGVEATGATLVPYVSVAPIPPGVNHEANWPLVEANINGRGVVDDLMAEHRADPIGALVVDSMSGAGLAVGEALDLPMAILVHTLYQPFVSWGPLVVNIRATREAAGLRPASNDQFPAILARASAILALVPPGFDLPMDPLPANTHYVGPILQPADSGAQSTASATTPLAVPGQPTVLISFGSTVQRQREALAPVLEAFARLPYRGLLTLGGVVPIEAVDPPENVEVRGHLPHASVLPGVAAVVCHGGLSTIMAALAAGKPLVVINQGRDQTTNGERVEASGAGLTLPTDAEPARIGAAIRQVIGEPRFAEGARGWARRIADLGGGETATGIVEHLAGSRADRGSHATATA
jgi:MGT family glycosyltransferase